MKKIGTPKQIVESFSILFGVYDNATEQLVVDTADNVLSACCANDCSVITGYLRDIDDKLTQIEGLLPIEDRIIFAQLLLKHGLIGEIEKKKKSENADYSDKFHAKEFVYMAVAHLGMSDTDAWNKSMTAFEEAMEAEFPANDKEIISQDDYDSAMAYADSAVGLNN
ncbi:hypothetical protein A9G09_05020 [Gilliamella sp. wkB292]|nr:hypothetical protein A9G09_05020 [Gilliamella apicola]